MNNNYIFPVNVSHFVHPETRAEFYTPENDIIFRTLFSDIKNEAITKKLFEHLIGCEIEDISLNANPEYLRTHINDKKMIADIKAIGKETGNLYYIEMQNSVGDFLTKRFSTYSYKSRNETLESGVDYSKLKNITQVVILSKNMPKFKDLPKYHTIWNSREQLFPEYVLDDSVTIHLIELPKYIEHKKVSNEINPWIEFIINPLGKEVTEAMRTDKELRLAVDMLNLLNSDEEVRDLAFAEKIAELDKNSALAEAKETGFSEGISQGIELVAINLLKNNTPIEDVANMTGLSLERLNELIKENCTVSC